MTVSASISQEVRLAQKLIQAPSPSGHESPAVAVLLEAMRSLDFDEVYQDAAGNAIGIFRRGDGPTIMLNGHLDTVPTGEESLWPYPSLSGAIEEGRLWGRGACDMKSAVACMAYAARDAVDAGIAGTLVVAGVVQEEVGGLGARHLGETLPVDVVVLGEPSKLKLMLGHRGRVEIEVDIPGKIAHAAKNSLGDNALYRAAALLRQLETLELPQGGPLLGSSLTPTQLQSFPLGGANVVPGRASMTIDYRNIPGDDPETIIERLQALAPEARFSIGQEHAQSENGQVKLSFPRVAVPYLAPGENPLVNRAREVIATALQSHQRPFEEDCWWFATDAPYLAKRGAIVLGFGPGEEELAHTSRESVPLEHLSVARDVYSALVRDYLKP